MARKKKQQFVPPVIDVTIYANTKILLFDNADTFIEYTNEHDLETIEDEVGTILRNKSLHDFEGIMGALNHVSDNDHPFKDGYMMYILINKPCSSVVVHESAHAAISILSGVGVPINGEYQEAFAYLLDYIYKECCTKLDIQGILPDEIWEMIIEEKYGDYCEGCTNNENEGEE